MPDERVESSPRPTSEPSRFGWILPGRLAGSGRPGRYGPIEDELAFLRQQGIGVIISLLESTLNLEEYRREGLEVHHFPVEDFTAPSLEQVAEACTVIDEALDAKKRVLVHCNAGIGRTGALLACYLVHRGAGAQEAVDAIRRVRPLSLETAEQVDMVRRYFEIRRRRRADASAGE